MPTLGGDQQYLQAELASISQSIKTLAAAVAKIQAILTAHGLS
jgi:prefoldin subunit 5